MSRSYNAINYSLRPAKCIERKMLVESFRNLSPFGAVESYRYVGMGSIYFSDFSLLHRALGIESMVSIEDEDDPTKQKRVRDNVPFGNISVEFGTTTAVLPTLAWDERTITWLDYDGQLNSDCLDDLAYVVRHAPSGSVLLFSVNVETPTNGELQEELGRRPTPLEALKANVGERNVPVTVSSADLGGWCLSKVYRDIALERIRAALVMRNGTLAAGASFQFTQIYYFHYKDGAKMMTLGGVLYDRGQAQNFKNCSFDQFVFCSLDAEPYLIECPMLTFSEMRRIEAVRGNVGTVLPIPKVHLDRFERTYRYFPKFVEAEVG